MKIVIATDKNLKDVRRIISVLDTKDYRPSSLEEVKDYISKGLYFIAVEDNYVVGAMALKFDDKSCQIYSLASKEKREGIGKALINFAINKCKEKRIPKIWCWSLKKYNANGFYEKMGFEESFLLKKQWFGEDCYFFGKVIM